MEGPGQIAKYHAFFSLACEVGKRFPISWLQASAWKELDQKYRVPFLPRTLGFRAERVHFCHYLKNKLIVFLSLPSV